VGVHKGRVNKEHETAQGFDKERKTKKKVYKEKITNDNNKESLPTESAENPKRNNHKYVSKAEAQTSQNK
jgi:hypothetical protein